ncbi:twin-arginine translocation pathway signal protein [Croceicoccus marinus]|nr:twin-arginine translocation pathway signal protein [Croceicoccus marinus]
MKRIITCIAPALVMAWALPAGGAAAAMAQTAAAVPDAPAEFVPADFAVPERAEGDGFRLVPLGPDLVDVDYAAYMSSISHLQRSFSRSTAWPTEGITAEDAMRDMENEQGRFRRRESFAYGVLTPDGSRERGSVYVSPSPVEGYDAVVRLWVTQAEHDAGFDARLYDWVRDWVAAEWPFAKVAYPGRAIDWATWDAMVAASEAQDAP